MPALRRSVKKNVPKTIAAGDEQRPPHDRHPSRPRKRSDMIRADRASGRATHIRSLARSAPFSSGPIASAIGSDVCAALDSLSTPSQLCLNSRSTPAQLPLDSRSTPPARRAWPLHHFARQVALPRARGARRRARRSTIVGRHAAGRRVAQPRGCAPLRRAGHPAPRRRSHPTAVYSAATTRLGWRWLLGCAGDASAPAGRERFCRERVKYASLARESPFAVPHRSAPGAHPGPGRTA